MSTAFWLDGTAPLSTPLGSDIECEVVVIGAGLCGTSTAKALCKEGVDVVLLEARVGSLGGG